MLKKVFDYLGRVAERMRFELTIGLPLYALSRGARSFSTDLIALRFSEARRPAPMGFQLFGGAGLLIVLTLVVTPPASAQAMPYSWLRLCATTLNAHCERPEITVQDLADLHRTVSAAIKTVENNDPFDPWTPFPVDEYGDCDDQAATERAALIALGMDPKALTFETGRVTEPDGREVGHIVLLVALGGKTYVLDRKMPLGLYEAPRRPYAWRRTATENHAGIVWITP